MCAVAIVKVIISVYNLSYVYPLLLQNERNGSLIDGSEPDPIKLLAELRVELTGLYECDRTRADAISKRIREVEKNYRASLNDYAEFWLLLAVGHKLADPLPINGHVASTYFGKAYSCAEKCTTVSPEDYEAMQQSYMEMLYTQLYRRANRPSSQMSATEASKYHRAAESVKHSYDRMFHTPIHAS